MNLLYKVMSYLSALHLNVYNSLLWFLNCCYVVHQSIYYYYEYTLYNYTLYIHVYLQSNAVSPTITQSPVGVTVIEGNTAVFVCQASALPIPAVNWDYYDPVSNSTSRVMDNADYEIIALDGDRNLTSTLTVLSTNVSDFEEYKCTAINVVGMVSATASLSVHGELTDIYLIRI